MQISRTGQSSDSDPHSMSICAFVYESSSQLKPGLTVYSYKYVCHEYIHSLTHHCYAKRLLRILKSLLEVTDLWPECTQKEREREKERERGRERWGENPKNTSHTDPILATSW